MLKTAETIKKRMTFVPNGKKLTPSKNRQEIRSDTSRGTGSGSRQSTGRAGTASNELEHGGVAHAGGLSGPFTAEEGDRGGGEE